jgi:amino acid adenylation domain-containing protein
VGSAAEKTLDGSLQAKGLGSISPDQGMALFKTILLSGCSQLVVAPIKWSDFIKNYPTGVIPSFFSEFRRQVSPKAPDYLSRPVSDLLTRYRQARGNKRLEVLKEHILSRIAEVLGWKDTASLSCSESFINLGLDSLMAVELKNMISQDLGKLALPDTLLFDQPNCDALVNYLAKKLSVAEIEKSETTVSPVTEPAVMAPRPESPEPISRYPLTYAQQGIWFLYKMNPAMYAFNLTIGLRILSDLDMAILQQTMQDLIVRHPVLRTRITELNGEPDQTVLDQVDLEIPVVDARTYSESELNSLVVQTARKPFVLEQDPLLRVAVFQLEQESILLLVIHHIIFDGTSTGILLDELTRLYSARMTEKPIMLQPLGLTFADFVHRQQEMLESERSHRLWDYWHKKLEGELPPLDLPIDFPRPVVRRFQGASHAFTIDNKLTDRIYKLCREEDSTLNMFMVAAFLVLLHRYSGQEDIVIGSPVAGRNQPGFEKVLGHFINLVVLRGNLSGNPGFSDFLKQIKQTVIEALQHQDFPFPLLVEKLNVVRDPSRTPVFQAALAFQSGSLGLFKGGTEEDGARLRGERYPIADQEGEADLTLELFERDRKLTALLKYNPDLFYAETIVRMTGHFNMLLESIATNPLQSLSNLNLLTDKERYLLLEGWQGKKARFPLEKSIARLFEEQVDKAPGRLAVIFENEQLTYQELNDRANQLAHHLKELGIEKDNLIGVFLERSLESVISILAILKTGCVYLPLDPTYPEERIRFMLDDSRARLILTRKTGKSKLIRMGYRHKTVDLSEPGIWRQLTYNPEKFYKPGNLAYVIYTSGSTGKPKGVMVEHPGFVNMIYDQVAGFGITPVDRCLQFAACSFDVSLFEIFMPLLSGAALVLATVETIKDGFKLVRYLEDKQVTVAAFTASYLRVLDQNPLPTVTTLIIGGEPSDSDDVLFYCKDKNYFNAYGPTEASVCATYYQCFLPLKARSSIPIGKPIANTCLYILDQALNPVPIGVQGEICISGPGLARGYLNQPELAKEAFVPHPFKPGERLYKTGDIGRWLADGTVEFIGRFDYQVKVRGFRIETREIENVLLTLPEISNAVVMEQKQPSGENRLVAYLVLKEHVLAMTSGRLRRKLSAYLPDYMIPSAFHGINQLPTTSSGKIDRNALRQNHPVESAVTKKTLQPGAQKLLGKIWNEILGKQEIGPHDNFFDLGGDSLLAIQIVSRIYKEFNQELPVAVFLQNQTIAELAEFLNQDRIDLPLSALVTIQPKGDQIPFFCVHGAGGNVMCYKALADKMGQNREFVGIQSTRLAYEPESVRTIESMATAYLQEIRQKQETGPYVIAGWCMGGCVALEIAQQLRQAEEEVTLILVDSFLLHSRQVNLWLKWHRTWRRLNRSESKRQSDSGEQKSDMKLVFNRRFRWNLFQDFVDGLVLLNEKPFVLPTKQLKKLELADRITFVTKELNRQGVFTIPIDEDRLLSEFKQFEANIQALLTYVPKPYEEEILLIKAAETYTQKGIWSTHDHGFATISSRLKIKAVPGNHFSILNPPNVDVVAKIINKQLKPARKTPVEKPPIKRSQLMKNEVSSQKIREIVTLAARTPTGDNCQPFRFAWDGRILAISHVDKRARHHFNYHNVGSILSLGMLLETISIIAKSQRLDVKSTLNLSTDLGDKVCAELEFTGNPDSMPDSLLTAIDQRVTDRRPYKGGEIQAPLFHKIKTEAEQFSHTGISFNNDFNKEILDYVCAFETYTWLTREAHHDVFEWIRYSKQETEATRDGMPWQSLGVTYLESRVLKLTKNYGMQTVLNKLGGLVQIKNLAKKMIRSSAGLGCVSIASLKPEDLAEAGRLVIRTWLLLNKNGYGLQPYALTSLVVLSYLMDPGSGHFNPDYKGPFESGRQVLQNYFKFPADHYPCWVFRTGITTPFPNSMKTLRLPTEAIWQER